MTVPYSHAVSKNFTYFLFDKEYVNNDILKKNNIDPYISDVYNFYYDHDNKYYESSLKGITEKEKEKDFKKNYNYSIINRDYYFKDNEDFNLIL